MILDLPILLRGASKCPQSIWSHLPTYLHTTLNYVEIFLVCFSPRDRTKSHDYLAREYGVGNTIHFLNCTLAHTDWTIRIILGGV